MLDVLNRQHLAHVGAAGGVADHRRAAADQRNRLVARHLQALHQRQRHKVAGRQAVGRAVKADVKRRFAAVDQVADRLLVGDLCDQAACLKLFVDSHFCSSFLFFGGMKKAPCNFAEGGITAVPPQFAPDSHPKASTGTNIPQRCNVRTRSPLRRKPFKATAPKCISARHRACLHRPQTLFAGRQCVLLFIHAVALIIEDAAGFVKHRPVFF